MQDFQESASLLGPKRLQSSNIESALESRCSITIQGGCQDSPRLSSTPRHSQKPGPILDEMVINLMSSVRIDCWRAWISTTHGTTKAWEDSAQDYLTWECVCPACSRSLPGGSDNQGSLLGGSSGVPRRMPAYWVLYYKSLLFFYVSYHMLYPMC